MKKAGSYHRDTKLTAYQRVYQVLAEYGPLTPSRIAKRSNVRLDRVKEIVRSEAFLKLSDGRYRIRDGC